MSRIGRKPIAIPGGVEVTVSGQNVSVKGPKGTLSFDMAPSVQATVTTNEEGVNVVEVTMTDASDQTGKAMWGTTRALIANMIVGVTTGFTKSLEIIGVGFRANVQGSKVVFEVGFSHPVEFPLPAGVTATVEKSTLTLTGIDAQVVGETAARIRRIRPPEPYKGTGIKYSDETIRRKAGKAGKAGAA